MTRGAAGDFSRPQRAARHVPAAWKRQGVSLLLFVASLAGCQEDTPDENRNQRVSVPPDSATTESDDSRAKQATDAAPAPKEPSSPNETEEASLKAPKKAPEQASSADSKEKAPFEGTAGIVEVDKKQNAHILQDVRSGKHPGFDRVVFEFDSGVPGYHLEYIDQPVRACGSGKVTPVAGDGWLEVRMTPAHAHTEAGEPTIREREMAAGLPVVREIQRTCDFEGTVTYVLGTSTPNRYRVLELKEPARLIVDVLHHN